jgi:hypothetical protein
MKRALSWVKYSVNASEDPKVNKGFAGEMGGGMGEYRCLVAYLRRIGRYPGEEIIPVMASAYISRIVDVQEDLFQIPKP